MPFRGPRVRSVGDSVGLAAGSEGRVCRSLDPVCYGLGGLPPLFRLCCFCSFSVRLFFIMGSIEFNLREGFYWVGIITMKMRLVSVSILILCKLQ